MGQEQIGRFIQSNSVQWIRNTQVNHLASEMLRAVIENDFTRCAATWFRPSSWLDAKTILKKAVNWPVGCLKKLGVWKLLIKGASWIGIDVQQRTVDSLLQRVESMLADPDHPWRQKIEDAGQQLMLQLADNNSSASLRLNNTKNTLLDSLPVLNFISGAVVILCNAIKDYKKPDSGIAQNLRVAIVSKSVKISYLAITVRQLLNEKMSTNSDELVWINIVKK